VALYETQQKNALLLLTALWKLDRSLRLPPAFAGMTYNRFRVTPAEAGVQNIAS